MVATTRQKAAMTTHQLIQRNLIFGIAVSCTLLRAEVPALGTVNAKMGPNLVTARLNQSVATLPDGKIVVFGGHGPGFVTLNSAEVYDPGDASFAASTMNFGHDSPGVFARLPDGRYLIGGGSADLGIPQYATCETYDPQSGAFTPTGSMVRFRAMGGAGTLTDGRVLVAGGWWTHNDAHTYGEIYDAGTGTFAATGPLHQPRALPCVLPTADGRAVVVGGVGYSGSAIPPTPELYDPQSNTFSAISEDLFPGEAGWTFATRQSVIDEAQLSDGRYLLLAYRAVEGKVVYRLIVFDPVTRAFSKFNTTPDLPDSLSMNWWAPLLNASKTIAYLPGYRAADSQQLNVLKVDLATGSLALPEVPATMPQSYSFYGSTFSLVQEGQVMIIGGTSGNNFGALPHTMLLTLDGPENAPTLSIALYAGINLDGVVGASYRIECAPDAAPNNWTVLTNLTLTSSPALFIDVSSTNAAHRLYRVVKNP